MAIVSLNTIKSWFKTGKKPTQGQFASTFDSFYHKDEKLTTSDIERLDYILNNKLDTDQFDGHVADKDNPHEVTAEQIGLGDIRERLDEKVDKSDSRLHDHDNLSVLDQIDEDDNDLPTWNGESWPLAAYTREESDAKYVHSPNGDSFTVSMPYMAAEGALYPQVNGNDVSIRKADEAGNADTVDGKHASDFAPVTALSYYVLKAGDTMTGTLNVPNIVLTATGGTPLAFSRPSANYITAPANGFLAFVPGGLATSAGNSSLIISPDNISSGNGATLGTAVNKWSNIYATKFTGDLTGNADTATRLKYIAGSEGAGGYDLNTLLLGGGVTAQYSGPSRWANQPADMNYGGVLQFNSGAYPNTNTLDLQLAYDINHNSTSSTKGLWFRAANNLGWQNDWKQVADRDWVNSTITTTAKNYLPLTGGTLSGNLIAPRIFTSGSANANSGISYYGVGSGYNVWQTYIANGGDTGRGVWGNLTASKGIYVTSTALRHTIYSPSSAYGWIWEGLSDTTGTAPAVIAELSANGNFRTKGISRSNGFVKELSGDSYALLGGGGHALVSTLNVKSAEVLRQQADVWVNANSSMQTDKGAYTFQVSSGSSNWPTTYGHGIRMQREAGTTISGSQNVLEIFGDLASNDDVYIRKSTGNGTSVVYRNWHKLIHAGNYTSYSPTLTGVGASGTWAISVTGNAKTATTLATARTLTVGNTAKTFNGSANVAWTLNEIGAASGGIASYTAAGTAAGRWIRVASVSIYNSYGIISLQHTYSNNAPTSVTFLFSCGYRQASQQSITQLGGKGSIFTKARIVYPKATNETGFIEVFYNTTSVNNTINARLSNALNCSLVTSYTEGSIPSTHDTYELSFNSIDGSSAVTANLAGNTTGTAMISFNNKRGITGYDSWLRINDTNAFTSGIYCGSSILRTDGALQVGSSGSSLNYTTSNALLFNRLQIDSSGRIFPTNTSSRRVGLYGVYDSVKVGHIWSIARDYQIADDGSTFGNLYGAAYYHTNNKTAGIMAGGHQMVWCTNGSTRAAMGENGFWAAGGFYKNGSSDSYVLLGGGGHAAISGLSVGSAASAGVANQLLTTRTIWGQPFNGTQNITGQPSFTNGIVLPYVGSSWITMATRNEQIKASINQTASAAHSLYSVRGSAGDAIAFGGLGNNSGFYGFRAADIASGNNVKNWSFEFNLGTGAINHTNTITATAFYANSDERLKNIKGSINPTLEDITSLPTFYYEFKGREGKPEIGTSAQKVQEKFPELVGEDEKGYLSVQYDRLSILALKGITLMKDKMDAMEERITKLEKQLLKQKKQ